MFSFNTYSQENTPNYVIDFITTEHGLSHNYTTSIISDDLNVKWIGTENGITKFNGYDFEYLKPGSKYKELLNENIEVLFKDEDSNIWIGTKSGGLSYLDIKNNIIKNFNHLINLTNEGSLRVTSISQDNQGYIWIGTWKKGIYVIDYKEEKLIEHFDFLAPVYTIIKDFNGYMWFPYGSQLAKYIPAEKKAYFYNVKGLVTDIISDPNRHKIWIATTRTNTKIYSYNYKTDIIESLETKIKSNFSKNISIDKYHRIWIGTWGNGVYRSNENLTEFSKIELVSKTSEKISANYNTILDIHQDINNTTWLATAHGGVVKLVEANGFKNANKIIKNQEIKDRLNCSAIYRDNNDVYIGTTYSGIYYGRDFSNLEQIKEIGNLKINVLYQHKRKLYIGTAKGITVFDLDHKKIISSSSFHLLKKITAFHIDTANNVYIGTQQRGFFIVKLEDINNKNAYKRYSEKSPNNQKIKNNRITSIKEDRVGNIWIGTYNGLHLYNKETNTVKHQDVLLKEKLPSAIINSMTMKGSLIWLATPSGVIKLKYENNVLVIEDKITKEDGLNSDFICDLTFDNKSNLWISTHTEIVKYNPIKRSIISYGDLNGINTTSFNNRSLFNYKNDTLYFGGINNITFFNPDKITDNNSIPELIFTTLKVNNSLIKYAKGNKVLDKDFSYASKLNLTHTDNFFSTRFVANDFLGNLNIKYRYLLDGYQKKWINLQNRNEINFAGLSPGNYTLNVQASRDGQNWSPSKSIDIILLNSPWKSPLALFIYAFLLIVIAGYLLRSYNYKLKLKTNLDLARIDKEKEVELTEAKLSFFTNISHEFRTPLTLIISPLKEILDNENLPPKILKNLSYIDKNTNKLLKLINQLLDFRKANHNLLKLNVSKDNFVKFSKEIHIYFKEAAKSKNIKLKFKTDQENIVFLFDRYKMEIVLSNLLSNAIKHSKSGDKITVTIATKGHFCTVLIEDTGIGIQAEYLDKIFDRFFQIKPTNSSRMTGSGIGLAFSKKIIELHHGSITASSKENVGTEFLIKIPMDAKLHEADTYEEFMDSDAIGNPIIENIAPTIDNENIDIKESTLLLIDDNLDILNYLTDILSDSYNIVQSHDGDSGFEMASSVIPDLIISDVMMPGKDGITLCKELKSQVTTSHIPIILLTAKTSTISEIEGLKTGADDYITKPFNAKVIKARISSLLENREKLRTYLLNKVRFEPTAPKIENESNGESVFIHKAIVLVEDNLDNASFGIHNMVDKLNMSQSTLYRKIKSLTGLSLTAFIRSVRLKKAASLILTQDMSLNQISFEVGFNDYKYFTVSFKKQFNCLPSKYKEITSNKQGK